MILLPLNSTSLEQFNVVGEVVGIGEILIRLSVVVDRELESCSS